MVQMGISNTNHVVIYDNNAKFGLFSAPRVWWMFRVSSHQLNVCYSDNHTAYPKVFGHEMVSVLDGGLPYWKVCQFPLERGPPALPCPQPYTASFNPDLVRSMEQVAAALESGDVQVCTEDMTRHGYTKF